MFSQGVPKIIAEIRYIYLLTTKRLDNENFLLLLLLLLLLVRIGTIVVPATRLRRKCNYTSYINTHTVKYVYKLTKQYVITIK